MQHFNFIIQNVSWRPVKYTGNKLIFLLFLVQICTYRRRTNGDVILYVLKIRSFIFNSITLFFNLRNFTLSKAFNLKTDPGNINLIFHHNLRSF